ncbi:MAG TPA: hypothetical protein VGM44_20315 [Polyangiaceae bacterium]
MKKVYAVGLFVVVAAMLSSACGSDDKLLKWKCVCNHDVCAASEDAAESSAGECLTSAFTQSCTSTGDSCTCPGGAPCAITIQ